MTHPKEKSFQDHYPDDFSHCYGCGRLNPHGHQLKSFWESHGETTIARFTPQPFHTGGVPENAYGGLIASLMDCHGAASAAAAAFHAEGRTMDTHPPMRFVTASLKVDFLKPTPLDGELTLKGEIKEVAARKVLVDLSLWAGETLCATGHMVAVKLKR